MLIKRDCICYKINMFSASLIEQFIESLHVYARISIIDNVEFILRLDGARQVEMFDSDMFDAITLVLTGIATAFPFTSIRLDAQMKALMSS